MADIIQPGTLVKIIGNRLPGQRVRNIETLLNTICPTYGIVSADIMHEFLANVLEESICFSCYEEKMSYSAQRLVQVWPKRFPNLEAAKPYEYNPKKLATKVYDFRPDLGNVRPGDGFDFRGSGPIQLTGRRNFQQFADYMKKKFATEKELPAIAELLRTSDEWGIHSACWLFAIAKQLIDEAIDDNMELIVKRINGALTNYKERLRYYELCKQFIK